MFVCIFLLFGLSMFLCVPLGSTQYIFHTPMARYSLFVLKAVQHQQIKTNKHCVSVSVIFRDTVSAGFISDLRLLAEWQRAFAGGEYRDRMYPATGLPRRCWYSRHCARPHSTCQQSGIRTSSVMTPTRCT